MMPSVSFRQAAAELLGSGAVGTKELITTMQRMRNFAEAVRILHAASPEKYVSVVGDGIRLVRGLPLNEFHPLEDAAFESLYNLLPLGDFFEESLQDSGPASDELHIEIAPLSPSYCWDTWYEALGDADQFDDRESLFVFFRCLNDDISLSVWDELSTHFRWNCPMPRLGSGTFDHQRFHDLLTAAGLEDFWAAYEIACYDTGCYYLDYNPYEPDLMDPIPFTPERVRWLQEEYARAQLVVARYKAALERCAQDETILPKIARMYARCVRPTAPQTARTLVEIFTQQEEPDDNDDEYPALVDPFYGPIGPDPDGQPELYD